MCVSVVNFWVPFIDFHMIQLYHSWLYVWRTYQHTTETCTPIHCTIHSSQADAWYYAASSEFSENSASVVAETPEHWRWQGSIKGNGLCRVGEERWLHSGVLWLPQMCCQELHTDLWTFALLFFHRISELKVAQSNVATCFMLPPEIEYGQGMRVFYVLCSWH